MFSLTCRTHKQLYHNIHCCYWPLQAQQPFVRALHGWSVDELRSYVAWAKAACPNLTMSTEAEQVNKTCLAHMLSQ